MLSEKSMLRATKIWDIKNLFEVKIIRSYPAQEISSSMELKIFKIKLKEGDHCEKTSKDASPHERSKESSSYFKIVKECAKEDLACTMEFLRQIIHTMETSLRGRLLGIRIFLEEEVSVSYLEEFSVSYFIM